MLPTSAAVPVVRPPLARRLGAGGLELFALFVVDVIGALLSPFTFFLSGVLTSLLVSAYTLVKDVGGGRCSFGKLVAQTQVVDAATGQTASARQCVGRNVTYAILWLGSALPDPVGSVAWGLIATHVLVDLLLVLTSPRARRFGDYVAGTEVAAG